MGSPTATYFRTAQLVPLFQKMLERCKVHKDETVLVVSDPDSNQEFVAAMFASDKPVGAICHGVLLAARSMGADGKSVLHGRKTNNDNHREIEPQRMGGELK